MKKNPVGLVAGVHGLETIGIRVLLEFLHQLVDSKGSVDMEEIRSGKVGVVSIPILNPGGVALKQRSNPGGVDLMRNSGIDGESSVPFFGGHKLSRFLPYYRGKVLEPESRALFRFVLNYLLSVKKGIVPVLDIHSGFGSINHVWWPWAGRKDMAPDEELFAAMGRHLRDLPEGSHYRYIRQNESYTVNGDLWDRVYQLHLARRGEAADLRLLPFTLELGTWAHIRENPGRLFKKRKLFNPPREQKQETIRSHIPFLENFVRLAAARPSDFPV